MIDNLFLDDWSQGDPIFDAVLTFDELVEFFAQQTKSTVKKISPVMPYTGKTSGETHRWVRFKMANGKTLAIHCGPSADALLGDTDGATSLSYGVTYVGTGRAKKVEKLFGFVASTQEDDWLDWE